MYFIILVVILENVLGSECRCYQGRTRTLPCSSRPCGNTTCSSDSECRQGESCQRRQIGRFITSMCSPRAPARKQSKGNSEYYCPGGGAVVVGYDGKLLSCDLLRQCSGEHICNPQYGVCCTKIRTCQRPAKTMLNAVTRKPILCQLKFGLMMPCPEGGFCETKTGFCCKSQGVDVTVTPLAKSRPWRGQPCVVREGCEGQAACMCDSRGCQCECPSELGYTVATDGKTCERVRRRLKEKCKTDMECSSAFSECSTGGCRCKKGFQRDGRGGCKPISYHCVNNGQPLDVAGDIVTCSMKASLAKLFFSSRKQKVGPLPTMNSNTGSGSNYSLSDWIPTEQDDCPDEYYCVPLFDDATRPGFYQGFCCPSPGETKPVCPVGEPHETSSPPSFGCKDCPLEYYCHRDAIFTEKSICCPKPCISLEDIYHDGQCYPTAFYGDSCQISAQCSPMRNSTDKYSENSPLDCVKGVCACRTGYSHINGECKRMMCTVGFRGEPSVDRNNQLIVCARSGDCSQGQMCDPNTHVCCKGNNRCPKGYVETGEFCENDNCDRPGALCFRAKSGKAKLCCAVEK